MTCNPLYHRILRPILVCGLLSGALLTPLGLQADTDSSSSLPQLGHAGIDLSVAKEQALGQIWLGQSTQRLTLNDDMWVNYVTQQLTNRLSQSAQLPYTLGSTLLIRSAQFNAFAALGGHVGIHDRVLLSLGSEAQLAAIIAHELAHLQQRHTLRLMEQQNNATPLLVMSILAAIAIAPTNTQAAKAVVASQVASSQADLLAYSRRMESEADRLGIQLLIRSGYPANAMARAFEQLQGVSRSAGGNVPEYLRTHPLADRRVADSALRSQPGTPANSISAAELAFQLMQVWLNHQLVSAQNDTSDAVYGYKPTTTQASVIQFDQALHQARSGKLNKLQQLAQHEQHSILHYAYAYELQRQQQWQTSLTYLQSIALPTQPYPLHWLAIQALYHTQQIQQAYMQLTLLQAQAPHRNHLALQIELAKQLGYKGRYYWLHSDWLVLHGHSQQAIQSLQQALQQALSSADRSMVLARLQQLEQMHARYQAMGLSGY